MRIKKHAIILSLALILTSGYGMGTLPQRDINESDITVCLDNVGATKCWYGTCGHQSTSYSYPSFQKVATATSYYYTGYYLDPNVTQTVSFSQSVTQSMTVGGGIDGSVAKASVGFTGGTSKTFSVSQSITNASKSRKYAHIGVEFETRKNTVTKKTRTYNPTWHLTAVDRYCTFSTSTSNQTCKLATGCGLSLRASK